MSSSLLALTHIINTNILRLESEYSNKGVTVPSLNDPSPGPLDQDPTAIEVAQQIVAAASQLIASVRPPIWTLREYAPAPYVSACLAFAVENNIAEILKEAGPIGLHCKEIGRITGSPEGSHTGRILRFLAMRHVFREISPDVFTNNRISFALVNEDNRSVAELQSNPEHKFDKSGIAGWVAHFADEGLKSSAHLVDFFKDPQNEASTPLNLAYGTQLPLFDWYEQPGNEWRSRRLSTMMTMNNKLFGESTFVEAFEWNALGPEDIVVDVGGSLGAVTEILSRNFSKPQFVIQDLASVIPGKIQYWESSFPAVVSQKRIKFQVHNFFAPQPISGAAVYFMRFVLHDWPDAECIQIMQNLRKAAGTHSKLILFEYGAPYACEDKLDSTATRNGKSLPAPVVPNIGMGTSKTAMDIHMLCILNSQERTLGAFIELGKASGWKFESVKYDLVSTFLFAPA